MVEVVAGEGAGPVSSGAGLSSLSREVVGGLLFASNTGIECSVSTVVGGEDGVLEAAGVLEVQVELAVLAALGDGNAGADGGDVGVEDEGHDGPVAGDGASNRVVGAASSTIGDTNNLDLGWVWGIAGGSNVSALGQVGSLSFGNSGGLSLEIAPLLNPSGLVNWEDGGDGSAGKGKESSGFNHFERWRRAVELLALGLCWLALKARV